MKLLVDGADVDEIAYAYTYVGVEGVTTNPSILARVGQDPGKVLLRIRDLIGHDELHVQVIGKTAQDMVEDALKIVDLLGMETYVKIPCVKEGYRAMKDLSKRGIKVTGTAVYMPMQGWLAAKAGAKYVAPYINRIDNMGYDGIKVCKEIEDMLRMDDANCGVLAASFKNSQQVLELAKYGIATCTASTDVIFNMMNNAAVDAAVDVFTQDWHKLTGKDRF